MFLDTYCGLELTEPTTFVVKV